MTERTCPADGCKTRIPLDKLMCPPHWRMVPPPLQADVYRAWRRRTRSLQSDALSDERQAALQGHRKVADMAVAGVNQRLAARMEGR